MQHQIGQEVAPRTPLAPWSSASRSGADLSRSLAQASTARSPNTCRETSARLADLGQQILCSRMMTLWLVTWFIPFQLMASVTLGRGHPSWRRGALSPAAGQALSRRYPGAVRRSRYLLSAIDPQGEVLPYWQFTGSSNSRGSWESIDCEGGVLHNRVLNRICLDDCRGGRPVPVGLALGCYPATGVWCGGEASARAGRLVYDGYSKSNAENGRRPVVGGQE